MIFNNDKSNNVSLFSVNYKSKKISSWYKFSSKELSQRPMLNTTNLSYKRNFTPSTNFKK